MFEKYLVEHCSPTLASLKTANLFTFNYSCERELQGYLGAWNKRLNDNGVQILALKKLKDKALIYVCRKAYLQQDLQKPGVAEFLSDYGYSGIDVDYALERLRSRLVRREDFPHEIGIFLGYPLGDVIGFIQNNGQNCKYAGCWKVYCDECAAVRQFAKYKKCKEAYVRLWSQGRSILRLTVNKK